MAQLAERFVKVAENNVEVSFEEPTIDVAGGTRIVLRRRDNYGQQRLDRERAKHVADLAVANRLNADQFKADAVAAFQAEITRQDSGLALVPRLRLTDANGVAFDSFDGDALDNFEAAGFGLTQKARAESDLAAEQARPAADKKQAEIDKFQARIDRLDLIQAAMDGPIT